MSSFLSFDRHHFINSRPMASTLKSGFQPDFCHFTEVGVTVQRAAQRQHIGMIMFPTIPDGLQIIT
jgi:hypothetical protein